MSTKKYVFCFIFDEKGQVLVLKRADYMRARPGEWDLPGGALDEAEPYLVGIKREVYEETGLEIDNIELIVRRGGMWLNGFHEFSYFRADMIKNDISLGNEHSEYGWHDPLVASVLIAYKPHLYGLTKLSKNS